MHDHDPRELIAMMREDEIAVAAGMPIAHDRATHAVEPPVYRPGDPTWRAGWLSCQRQAAEIANGCANSMAEGRRIWANRPGGIPHYWLEAWGSDDETARDIRDAILAMRPTPPTMTREDGE